VSQCTNRCDDTDLDDRVSAAASFVMSIVPNFLKLEPIDQFFVVLKISRDNDLFDAIDNFEAVKKARQEINGLWLTICSSGSGIELSKLHVLLVINCLNGTMPTQYLSELTSLPQEDDLTGVLYFAVWGSETANSIALTDQVKLLPWGDVPDNTQRKRFIRNSGLLETNDTQEEPNIAIAIHIERMVDIHRAYEKDYARSMAELTEAYETAQDVLRVLMLSCCSPMWLIGSWPVPNSERVRRFAGSSTSTAHQSNLFLWRFAIEPKLIEPSILLDLWRGWGRVSETEKKALRVSIDRCVSGAISTDDNQTALDQGIAFEIILMHGAGQFTGEITYRLAVRAARFIGGSQQEQYKNFRLVRELYNLRSKVAHAGQHNFTETEREKLIEGRALYVGLVKRVIARGGFPDWEKDIVFGE
jgi:hypothetical protein